MRSTLAFIGLFGLVAVVGGQILRPQNKFLRVNSPAGRVRDSAVLPTFPRGVVQNFDETTDVPTSTDTIIVPVNANLRKRPTTTTSTTQETTDVTESTTEATSTDNPYYQTIEIQNPVLIKNEEKRFGKTQPRSAGDAQASISLRKRLTTESTTQETTDITNESTTDATTNTPREVYYDQEKAVPAKQYYDRSNSNAEEASTNNPYQSVELEQPVLVKDKERRFGAKSKQLSGRGNENSQKSYRFAEDFESLINPANPNAEWKWLNFVNKNANADDEYNNYTANAATFLRSGKKSSSTVDFISIPFPPPIPPSAGRIAAISNYKAALINKKIFEVEEQQSLVVNFTFSCKLFNIKDTPVPKSVSVNPENDPTLGNCRFAISSLDPSALAFAIEATDKGIWGVYKRSMTNLIKQPQNGKKMFSVYKLLGKRQSPYQTVEAAIIYDRPNAVVNYYINDQLVWTVGNLGTLKQQQQPHGQAYTVNRPDLQQVVVPTTFDVSFGLANAVDEPDPDTKNPESFASRVVGDPSYYDPKAKFFDEEGRAMYNVWGQGATMTLKEANIAVV